MRIRIRNASRHVIIYCTADRTVGETWVGPADAEAAQHVPHVRGPGESGGFAQPLRDIQEHLPPQQGGFSLPFPPRDNY